MKVTDGCFLVTGGGGFIGSHLVERLLANGNEVVVADDFSSGDRSAVPEKAEVIHGDLTDPEVAESAVDADIDGVFHLAARKAVNEQQPRQQFEANTRMTYNLLAAMEDADVSQIVFTSSSTVYGEAPRPTPEDYGPLEPISVYGASKLADEGLLSSYAHSNSFTVWNFRFANIVGPGLRGAVIPDFVDRLREDPDSLTILGDGHQEKSYMHIDDCLDAMFHTIDQTEAPFNSFNLGTQTTTSVTRIADIVSEILGVSPTYEFTGGKQGWRGDVSRMRLSIEKLRAIGWRPDLSSDEAVERAARELAD